MRLEHCVSKLGIEGYVPEHVGDNEESHVAAANVDLVEMGDTAVASGHRDILQLNVHVVLGWENVSIHLRKRTILHSCCETDSPRKRHHEAWGIESHTFQKLPPVDDTRCDLERHDMAL